MAHDVQTAPADLPTFMRDGLVMVAGSDGPDYVRACYLHRWASLPAARREDVSECPYCDLMRTDRRGVRRFEALLAQMRHEAGGR